MTPIQEIVAERQRQQRVEGWTPQHDDAHVEGELAWAAAAYASNAGMTTVQRQAAEKEPPAYWPFGREWWKPSTRRRALVKAAAMIVAEIERLDRLAEWAGE